MPKFMTKLDPDDNSEARAPPSRDGRRSPVTLLGVIAHERSSVSANPRRQPRHVHMPNIPRARGKGDAGLNAPRWIEQAQKNVRGMGGKHRKIDPIHAQAWPHGIGQTFANWAKGWGRHHLISL
jgi:hypothetical protein